jgi:hypothetical protein
MMTRNEIDSEEYPSDRAASLRVDTRLMEEYFYSIPSPRPAEIGFCAVEGKGCDAFLAIIENPEPAHPGNYWYFYEDKRQSSGWNRQSIPLPFSPGTIHGFQAVSLGDRTIVVCSTNSSFDVCMERRDGQWNLRGLAPNCTGVKILTTDSSALLYGFWPVQQGSSIKTQFFIHDLVSLNGLDSPKLLSDLGQEWSYPDGPPPEKYILIGSLGASCRVVRIKKEPTAISVASRLVQIREHDLVWAGDWTATQSLPLTWEVADLRVLSDRQELLLVGGGGELCLVHGFDQPTLAHVLLPGLSQGLRIDSSVAVQSEQGSLRILGLDSADKRIWICRETAAGSRQFHAWVALGTVAAAITSNYARASGTEVFAIVPGAEIVSLYQAAAGRTWQTCPIELPSAADVAPKKVSSYTTEITAVNQGRGPVRSSRIHIRSDRRVHLQIDGLTYAVDADHGQDAWTDQSGKVRIVCQAREFHAPTLLVYVPDFMKEGECIAIHPDVHAHRRLSGADCDFPVTGEVMRKEGLLSANYSRDDADRAAESVAHMACAMVESEEKNDAEVLGAWLQDSPYLVGMEHVPRLQSYSRLLASTENAPLAMSFLQNSITHEQLDPAVAEAELRVAEQSDNWISDIAHFFSSCLEKIERIVIGAWQGVYHVIVNGIAYLVKRVEEWAAVIELVFKKVADSVGEAVEKALHWLEEVLHWDSVLSTKQILRTVFDSFLDWSATELGDKLPAYVSEKFKSIEHQVGDYFDKLEGSLGGPGATFFSACQKAKPKSVCSQKFTGNDPLHPVPMRTSLHGNSARANLLLSKLLHAPQADSSSPIAAMPQSSADKDEGPVADLIKELEAFAQKILTQTGAAFSAAFDRIKNLLDSISKDPDQLFRTSVKDIVATVRDLAVLMVEYIDDAIVVLMRCCGVAIKALKEVLDQKIQLPFLSWLYKELTQSDLSLMDLVCLLIALPLTVLMEALYGPNPFTAKDAQRVSGLANLWPLLVSKPGNGSDAAAPEPAGAGFSPEFSAVAFGVVFTLYAGFDILLDALAFGGGAQLQGTIIPAVISGGAIGLAILAQWFGVPTSLAQPMTPGDKAAKWYWLTGFLPILLDTVCLCFYKSAARLTQVGPALCSLTGVGLFVGGVVATCVQSGEPKNYGLFGLVENLLAPLPIAFQALVYAKRSDNPVAVAAAAGILLAIDAICDVGVGGLHIAGFYVPVSSAPSGSLQQPPGLIQT